MRAAVKAKFVNVEGEVMVARYDSERWALAILEDGMTRPEVLSINLVAYGFEQPAGHVFVKAYSEHEGLPHAIEAAGIATRVSDEAVRFGPYDASAWLMKLSDELLKQGPR